MANNPFQDAQADMQARLLAAAPWMTQSLQSVTFALMNTFLGTDAQTNVALQGSAPNITYTTATGQALINKAADYGVNYNAGTAGTSWVVFYFQAAAAVTQTIPAGTAVSTAGSGVTSPQIVFTTLTPAIISSGNTNCAVPIQVMATAPGANTNVAAGAINQVSLSGVPGLFVSNALTVDGVSNPSGAGVGGTDPDSISTLRRKIAAVASPQYGVAAYENAITAIPGVYDAFVLDPQTGSDYVYYYWCDVTGAAGTIAGGAVVGSGSPDFTNYISGATLSGLASQVDATIRAVLGAQVLARIGGAGSATSPFLVENLTAIAYTYSAPSSLQSSFLEPLINAGLQAYVQSLLHNEIPTQFGAAQAAQAATGKALTNFVLGSTTPAIGSAANTTIYRALSPSFTPTRV